MKRTSKILSLILAIAMIVGLFPTVTAFADDVKNGLYDDCYYVNGEKVYNQIVKIGEDYYYFMLFDGKMNKSGGALGTGTTALNDDGGYVFDKPRYYTGEDGKIDISYGFEGNYFYKNGEKVKNMLVTLYNDSTSSDDIYFITSTGKALKNANYSFSNTPVYSPCYNEPVSYCTGKFHFDENGRMEQKFGVVDGRYYTGTSYVKGMLIFDGGNIYYAQGTGLVLTNAKYAFSNRLVTTPYGESLAPGLGYDIYLNGLYEADDNGCLAPFNGEYNGRHYINGNLLKNVVVRVDGEGWWEPTRYYYYGSNGLPADGITKTFKDTPVINGDPGETISGRYQTFYDGELFAYSGFDVDGRYYVDGQYVTGLFCFVDFWGTRKYRYIKSNGLPLTDSAIRLNNQVALQLSESGNPEEIRYGIPEDESGKIFNGVYVADHDGYLDLSDGIKFVNDKIYYMSNGDNVGGCIVGYVNEPFYDEEYYFYIDPNTRSARTSGYITVSREMKGESPSDLVRFGNFIQDGYKYGIAENGRLYRVDGFMGDYYYNDGQQVYDGIVPIFVEGSLDISYGYIQKNGKLLKNGKYLFAERFYDATGAYFNGYYSADEQGILSPLNGPDGDYFYNEGEMLKGKIVYYEGDYYYYLLSGKILKDSDYAFVNKFAEFDDSGEPFTGKYHFDEDGKMDALSGIVGDYYYKNGKTVNDVITKVEEGDYYYFQPNGKMLKNGKFAFANKAAEDSTLFNGLYEADADGKILPFNGVYNDRKYVNGLALVNAVDNVEDDYYYYQPNGLLLKAGKYIFTNKILDDGNVLNGLYEADADGKLSPFSGIYKDRYYDNGSYVTDGLVYADGDYYYCRPNGSILKNGTYAFAKATALNDESEKFFNGVYGFGADGKMDLTDGLKYLNGDVYYMENGEYVAKGLVKDENTGKLYYINGTKKAIKGGYYAFSEANANGLMAGGKYYFNKNSELFGKVKPEGLVDGKYYVDEEPVNTTLVKEGDFYYYVDEKGEIAKDTYKTFENKTALNDESGKVFDGEYLILADGKLDLTDGFKTINKTLYYFNNGEKVKETLVYNLNDSLYYYFGEYGWLGSDYVDFGANKVTALNDNSGKQFFGKYGLTNNGTIDFTDGWKANNSVYFVNGEKVKESIVYWTNGTDFEYLYIDETYCVAKRGSFFITITEPAHAYNDPNNLKFLGEYLIVNDGSIDSYIAPTPYADQEDFKPSTHPKWN